MYPETLIKNHVEVDYDVNYLDGLLTFLVLDNDLSKVSNFELTVKLWHLGISYIRRGT